MVSQVMAWSFNYIAAKLALENLQPVTLASFRLVLAGSIYLGIILVMPRRFRLSRRDVPLVVVLGIFGVAINQSCFTIALGYTSIGDVALILATAPVLVLLLARLIGQEVLSPAKVTGIVLSFSGVALLAVEQGARLRSGGLFGDLIALLGCCGFACYTVFGKGIARRHDPISFNALIHLTGAVLWCPVAIHQALGLNWGHVTWKGWTGLGYMAIFGSVAGYLIFYKLLGYISATQVASLNYLLPIVATSLAVLLLHERVDRLFLLAAGLVLTGLWLAQGTRWQTVPAD